MSARVGVDIGGTFKIDAAAPRSLRTRPRQPPALGVEKGPEARAATKGHGRNAHPRRMKMA